jgi:hypothetical protein
MAAPFNSTEAQYNQSFEKQKQSGPNQFQQPPRSILPASGTDQPADSAQIGGVGKRNERPLLIVSFLFFGLEVLTIPSGGSKQKLIIAFSFPHSFLPATMMFRNSILLLATAVVVTAQVSLLLLVECGT